MWCQGPLRGARQAIAWAPALLPAGCAPLAETLPGIPPGAWLVMAAGVLLNATVLGGGLLAWERLTRRRRLRERLERELRHLRLWRGEEGVMRKVGLLRDLNDLGAVPAELEGVELVGADLKGVRLTGCRLRGALLQGADLQGAALDGADLFGAELTQANLTLASLRGANLRGANLESATLVKAELAGANLHRANLVQADLTGTQLDTVTLNHARFAQREEGIFQQSLHPSVEDWIRERLDRQGCYRPPEEGESALTDAG